MTRIKAFWPPILLMVVITTLSSVPGEVSDDRFSFVLSLNPMLQNLLHIPLFALLQLLWLRAFSGQGKTGPQIVMICLLLTVLFGIGDECHQFFVPGRYASLLDVILDGIGGLLGSLLFLAARRYRFCQGILGGAS